VEEDVGAKFSQELKINAPSDIKTHLRGIDDGESNFYSSIIINEEKIWLQQKGHFLIQGKRGWCLSTTWALSVHVPG